MISFLRLIRWLNLFYIVLAMYLVQYTIVKPILASALTPVTLGNTEFFLLVLSTILVAAGGYVINDYFDVKADEVNKPRRIFIGRTIHHRSAILLHQALTGAGVVLAFYVAWKAGDFKLGLIHVIVAAFLWFYSTNYKRRLLVGNLLVAFLSGMVILIVGLYERHLFIAGNTYLMQASYSVFVLLFIYFLFAFLLSLARELAKDVEDIAGDRKDGCQTVPVVFGIRKTKWVIAGLLTCVFALLTYIQLFQVCGGDPVSGYVLFTTLQFPLLITFYLLYGATEHDQFSTISSMLKIVMFLGMLSMLYFYFLTHH